MNNEFKEGSIVITSSMSSQIINQSALNKPLAQVKYFAQLGAIFWLNPTFLGIL